MQSIVYLSLWMCLQTTCISHVMSILIGYDSTIVEGAVCEADADDAKLRGQRRKGATRIVLRDATKLLTFDFDNTLLTIHGRRPRGDV